jgi:hypothetical protein
MFSATDIRISQVRLIEWKRLTIQYYTFNRVFLILFEFNNYGLKKISELGKYFVHDGTMTRLFYKEKLYFFIVAPCMLL